MPHPLTNDTFRGVRALAELWGTLNLLDGLRSIGFENACFPARFSDDIPRREVQPIGEHLFYLQSVMNRLGRCRDDDFSDRLATETWAPVGEPQTSGAWLASMIGRPLVDGVRDILVDTVVSLGEHLDNPKDLTAEDHVHLARMTQRMTDLRRTLCV